MAQKYVVQVVDDLDGSELDPADVDEVRFALDGQAYLIDLSHTNADGLRKTLGRYVEAARPDRVGSSAPTRSSVKSSSTAGKRKDLDEVRTWANANGYTVSSRGRIPGTVLQAYDAIH